MKKLASKRIIHCPLLLGGAAFIAGTSLALSSTASAGNQSKNSALNLKIDESPLNADRDLKSSFAPIVQKVTPSVVKIFVSSSLAEPAQLSDPDVDYFGDIPWQSGSLLEHTLGSGVIVSPDGYILTNNHLVKDAKEIQVALNDGRTFTAKVIGTDPQTDIALIRVQADNLSALTFTNSDKVNVGDVVLAVGNPFGVGQTVTSGIVSARNRVISSDMDEDFIQIDAAIDPGNSGGALVDTDGRLIGINTAILSRSGGSQGISLAIPSNLCRWVMDGLVKFGHVNRGFLGVEIQDLTPDLAQAFKINNTEGALVTEVTPGSAAAAAGLQSGDVIIRFNDQSVQDSSQLKLQVAETGPGITVPVGVVRNGENRTFRVTLKEQANNEMASANSQAKQNGSNTDALHGVAVSDLDDLTRVELSIPVGVHGALVTEMDPTSPAYEAGVRTGDVILEINRDPIKNAQDAVNDTAKPMGNDTLVQ